PDSHRELLPAFPAETGPGVPDAAPPGALAAFCRAALLEAVRGDGPSREAPAGGLLGRVAAAISFDRSSEGCGIRFQQTPLTDLETFVRRVRDAWSTTEGNARDAGVRARGLRAAEHVLSHLPQGGGVTTRELARALARLDLRLPEEELARFCEDGVRIGLVVRGGDGAERCYATAPAIRLEEGEAELAFRAIASGIEIDLERTGLDALLQLAAVSRVDVLGARLRLSPDVAVLGRAAPRFASIKPLGAVRAASAVFREALERVEKRHGTLLLHDGLLLLRIEDLGFRTLLSHRFEGRVRSLEGAYMAAPLALARAIERLARQEGYSPRRVT
ncbi:MAG: hypothetical protein ACREQY_14975, partial [Candidatus Binatia bacterium]